LTAASAALTGHIADVDKPAAWEGTAAEHIVMIQFDNLDQAQARKSSDAFRGFVADLHRGSEATLEPVQVYRRRLLADTLSGEEGGFDQKAFEANVKTTRR
jgi:hypothetical protein